MAAMNTATVAVGGTDNNQPKGAAKKMTAVAMVRVAETTMATETAMVTVAITTSTLAPTTGHQLQ